MASAGNCIPFVVPEKVPAKSPQGQPKRRTRRNAAEVLTFPNSRMITAEDMGVYVLLSKEASRAAEKLARKREHIVALLRAGSEVEKGAILEARLVTVSRCGKTIERLEVR